MSQQIIDRYVADVHACLKKASEMFGVNLNPANVVIDCDLFGRTAGWAHPAKAGKYRLRFNQEAIIKFPEKMADTIPHEVAHLVCFANPSHGRNHDQGWKNVCRRLGGDESRTHDMVLTPPKKRRSFATSTMWLAKSVLLVLGSTLASRMGSLATCTAIVRLARTLSSSHGCMCRKQQLSNPTWAASGSLLMLQAEPPSVNGQQQSSRPTNLFLAKR